PQTLRPGPNLFIRGGPERIASGHQNLGPVSLEGVGKFRAGGGFAGPIDANQADDGRLFRGGRDRGLGSGKDAFEDSGANGGNLLTARFAIALRRFFYLVDDFFGGFDTEVGTEESFFQLVD